MRSIIEYLSANIKPSIIYATNDTIKQIVKDELDRLGHDADLNHIDVNKVINMDSLFSCFTDDLGSKYKDLNPDISKWNTSNVTCMRYMFYSCKNFNCDISNWDIIKVETTAFMFWSCEKFNQDISQWNVRNVKWMREMFLRCKNFNQDLSQWNVKSVCDYDGIFNDCPIKEEYKPKFK